jgi:hypothetical protein
MGKALVHMANTFEAPRPQKTLELFVGNGTDIGVATLADQRTTLKCE